MPYLLFMAAKVAWRLTRTPLRSFWKYVKKLDRREARRYLEMFYILRLRPLIAQARACTPRAAAGQEAPVSALCHVRLSMTAQPAERISVAFKTWNMLQGLLPW